MDGGPQWLFELTQFGEEPPRTHRRMSRQRDLGGWREEADQPRCVFRLRDKNRFGEVHLARQRLHGSGVQPLRVRKDGQRVPVERRVREHVELVERMFAHHHVWSGTLAR